MLHLRVSRQFYLILVFLLLAFLSGCSKHEDVQPPVKEEKELTTEERKPLERASDIDYFAKELPERHIDLFKYYDKREFEYDIQHLKAIHETCTDNRFAVELMKILAKVKDGHTNTFFVDYSLCDFKLYPVLNDNNFIDFILASYKGNDNEEAIGKKVISINGFPIKTICDSIVPTLSVENEYHTYHQLTGRLPVKQYYEVFNFWDAKQDFTLGLSDGTTVIINENSSEHHLFSKFIPPLNFTNIRTNYWYKELKEENILYVAYNRCFPMDSYSFNQFVLDLKDVLEEKKYKKIVIDLRNNGGGSTSLDDPLLTLLENYIKTEYCKSKDIYVATAWRSYSAAQWCALDLKKIGCTLIGQPIGNNMIRFGDAPNFTLPYTKYPISYSTKFFDFFEIFNISPVYEGPLHPDILITETHNDFITGRDPILEYIKMN